MVNQVPLTFFATFKSKAAKQLKEVVSQNEIHYTTITANLFESSQMHPGIHFHKGVLQSKIHYTVVTANLFAILEMLSCIYLKDRTKCFPLVWIWGIISIKIFRKIFNVDCQRIEKQYFAK